jgi:N-acetylmuramoyl-L-alanine amidase
MPLPILKNPLRYLIGGDDDIEIQSGFIYELSYDATYGDTAYGNLRDERGRYNSLQDANNNGPYAPYLPPDDITVQYGEYCPDPRGSGYLRNIREQIQRKKATGAIRIEFDNPDTMGLDLNDVLNAHDAAWDYGLNTVAKNPMLVSNPTVYVGHPSVDLVICERNPRNTPTMLHELRLWINQPLLAIRFIAFVSGSENGEQWAQDVVEEIEDHDYLNMGVTISYHGEYTSAVDLILPKLPEEESMATHDPIVISSGHGKYIRGASGYLDEVDEARRVVERTATILKDAGVNVKTFHDNTSHDQNTNLHTIVNYHNAQTRDLDVSVHFNAYQTTNNPMGTECLYVTQSTLADQVSEAISDAGDFIDRGPKKRTDLYFLNNTEEPAILIETCFVDSRADADLYNRNFEAICQSIAESISGIAVGEAPPDTERPPIEVPPIDPGAPVSRPTIKKGSTGSDVVVLQRALGVLPADGDFGSITDTWVRAFQGACSLSVDGIVGPNTWSEVDALEVRVDSGELPLPGELANQIITMAKLSEMFDYSWPDRGIPPEGYISGMCLCFAYAVLKGGDAAAVMSRAEGNADTDALAWYHNEFSDLGMSNRIEGVDTMRHLFVMATGLGPRESSGRYFEGRDMSADNVQSDTCEAGLFQTSWNIRNANSTIGPLLTKFWKNPNGFLPEFKLGLSPSANNLNSYGSGDGIKYQFLSRFCPLFHTMVTGVGMRTLRKHWGPIERREVLIKREMDDLLKDVQDLVEAVA